MKKLLLGRPDWEAVCCLLIVGIGVFLAFSNVSLADVGNLPGKDESAKLEAAGTLLRLIDTGLFKWGARLFAGLCIMSGAWALKEQRFGMAVICVIGAVIFGTAPTWVKNVFSISGESSIFSRLDSPSAPPIALNTREPEEPHGSV